MKEIVGKWNSAKVFIDNFEESTKMQIESLLAQRFCEGCKIAVMPDCHAGAGCVIGFTQTITDKVVPNLVGVDIGCSVSVVKISGEIGAFNLEKMDMICRRDIPSGRGHRREKLSISDGVPLEDLVCPMNAEKERLSIGSLGGGNHFEEIDRDEDGNFYIVVHTGSRNMGVEIAHFHQKRAISRHKSLFEGECNEKIAEISEKLKAEGREGEIEAELQALYDEKGYVPPSLAYLEGGEMADYLHDMRIAQEFSRANHEAIVETILSGLKIKDELILERFRTMHNYIDLDNMILRKGAISLQKGEKAIIPINMAFGSLIVEGKGNPDWNFSGPHGAGRVMTRTKAFHTLKIEDFKKAMEGVYSTCIKRKTIDESPMAYKNADDILENIEPAAQILHIIKPIYNFKASEGH